MFFTKHKELLHIPRLSPYFYVFRIKVFPFIKKKVGNNKFQSLFQYPFKSKLKFGNVLSIHIFKKCLLVEKLHLGNYVAYYAAFTLAVLQLECASELPRGL